MTWLGFGRLAWQYKAYVGLLLFASLFIHACRQRDAANVALGEMRERARVADSSLRVNSQQLRITDTLWRHDTLTVRRTIARLDTLRDTVLRHLTDTALVVKYVERADSTVHACTDALNTCAQFRTLAYQRFDQYESKIKSLESLPRRRRCGIQATVGPTALYDFKATHIGVGGMIGLGCQW